MSALRCKSCGNRIVQRNKFRVEGGVTVTKSGVMAKCYSCKAEIKLPLVLEPGFEMPNEQLVIVEHFARQPKK